MPKNGLSACFFFFKNCLRRLKYGKNGFFLEIRESSESQFGRPTKRSTKFSKFFLGKNELEKVYCELFKADSVITRQILKAIIRPANF